MARTVLKEIIKRNNLESKGYEIKRIDLGECIYKDYGLYDIEVNVWKEKKKLCGKIYLWYIGKARNKNYLARIFKSVEFHSEEELLDLLGYIDVMNIEELATIKLGIEDKHFELEDLLKSDNLTMDEALEFKW